MTQLTSTLPHVAPVVIHRGPSTRDDRNFDAARYPQVLFLRRTALRNRPAPLRTHPRGDHQGAHDLRLCPPPTSRTMFSTHSPLWRSFHPCMSYADPPPLCSPRVTLSVAIPVFRRCLSPLLACCRTWSPGTRLPLDITWCVASAGTATACPSSSRSIRSSVRPVHFSVLRLRSDGYTQSPSCSSTPYVCAECACCRSLDGFRRVERTQRAGARGRLLTLDTWATQASSRRTT